MRHIELHIIEADADIQSAINVGLLEPGDLNGAPVKCVACSEEVGHVDGVFYEFAVVLDDRSKWFVCLDCVEDIAEPSPAVTSYEDLFAAEEEFEQFSLNDDE